MIELFSADGWLNQAIVSVNYFTWTYIPVAGLVILCFVVYMADALCAVSHDWRDGSPIRRFDRNTMTKVRKHVSSFPSFCRLNCLTCRYWKPCWVWQLR